MGPVTSGLCSPVGPIPHELHPPLGPITCGLHPPIGPITHGLCSPIGPIAPGYIHPYVPSPTAYRSRFSYRSRCRGLHPPISPITHSLCSPTWPVGCTCPGDLSPMGPIISHSPHPWVLLLVGYTSPRDVTHGICCPWILLCVGSHGSCCLWLLLLLGATHPWTPSPMGAITAGAALGKSHRRHRGDGGRGLAVGTRWWQWEGHGQMCLLSSCSSESAFPSAFPHSWLSIPHPRGRFTLKAKLCPSRTCWLRVELSCSVLWRCFSTRLSHSSVERGLIRSLLLGSDVLCKAPRPEGAAGFGYRHCLFAVVCKGVLSLELGFMQPLRTPNL